MKYFIFLTLLISLNSYSAEAIKVHSVGNGSCWVKIDGEEVNIAGFSSGVSKFLTEDDYRIPLKKALKDVGASLEDLKAAPEVYLHCGAYGANLVFNLALNEDRLCVWSDLKDRYTEWGSLLKTQKGQCEGNIPGSFLLQAETEEEAALLEKEVKAKEFFKGKIKRIALHGRFITVDFHYKGSQSEIMNHIVEQLKESSYFKGLIPNQKLHANGEFFKIELE